MQIATTCLPAGNASPPTGETFEHALRGVRDPHTGLDNIILGWVRLLSGSPPKSTRRSPFHGPYAPGHAHWRRPSSVHSGRISAAIRLHIRWNGAWYPADGSAVCHNR